MGRIWLWLMLLSVAVALLTDSAGAFSAAILSSGEQAVKLTMTLLAGMTLWSGLTEMLVATGDMARLGRCFRRLMKPLFRGMEDEEAWDAISLNLSANLLGLGNAATPAGITAAKRLAALGEPGLRALAMLLVLDSTGVQLLPTSVITLRQTAGAADPADIWGMTLLISGVSTVIGVLMMSLLRKGGMRRERMVRDGARGAGGTVSAAGRDDGL